jgi:ATP-binding cassette subfamily C protein CydD
MDAAQKKAWIRDEQKAGQVAARKPIFWGVVQTLFGVGQGVCAAHLLAAVLGFQARDLSVLAAAGGFALCVVMRAAAGIQAERLGFEAGAAARRRLRGGMIATILARGPMRSAHTAGLAATAVDGVEAMDGFYARWIPATAMAVIGPAIVGLAVLIADWRSGIVLLIAGLTVPFAMAVAGIGAGVAARKQFVAMSRLQTRFLDRIRGIATIVLAGRAADEAAALAAAAQELRQRTMRVLRVAFLSSTALDLAAAAALILVLVRFAPAVRGDAALAPVALFVLLLVPEFFAPLRAFSAVYADRLGVEAVADEFAALPAAPAPVAAAAIRNVAATGVTLAFDHVSFAWDATRGPVFSDLSFRVASGETLLLTGASGAGKSTILDLILGFIAPASGVITINGAPLASLVPAARTAMVGYVGQKPMLFAGTVEDNVRFSRPEATAEQVAEAVRLARLTDLLASLPAGLQTVIGEGGFGLSGGQAQRIAIARAFLKNAPLLLLDEPTAHLDPVTERDVLDSLRRLAIGRTVILASHSTLAAEFARETGARRLDLDAAKLEGVA